MMNERVRKYAIELRKMTAAHVTLEELKEITYDLGVDWDELPGEVKSRKTQALIMMLMAQGQLDDLVNILRDEFPNSDWPAPPPSEAQRQYSLTKPLTAAIAVGSAAASIRMIDQVGDQVMIFLTNAAHPVPIQHRLMFRGDDTQLVAQMHGDPVQRITAEELKRLPDHQLRHITILESSMERHYREWEHLYLQRGASADENGNERVERQLRQVVTRMADDLEGILSFLEMCGFQLDDHYLHYRHVISRVGRG